MPSRRQIYNKSFRSLVSSVTLFGALIAVLSASLVFLNQFLNISWWIIFLVSVAALALLLGTIWWRGIFISPWSLRLRSLYQKYKYTGLLPLLRLLKSREKKRVEILKGVFRSLLAVVVGASIYLIQSVIFGDPPFTVQGGVLSTTWQVHAVIIGFSFVALTFAWEEIYSNPLNEELTRLFIEDIGSIWTVTFVFTSNLFIGLIAFVHSSAENTGYLPVYVTAVLFASSIYAVATRFLDALDLLFYTDFDEEVKEYAKENLEKEMVNEFSNPNRVLSESVPGFEHISAGVMDFGLERTSILSRDIDKAGTVTDINLKNMRRISQTVEEEPGVSIRRSPSVGTSLAEDTTVLSLDGDVSEEALEEIERQLRRGIRSRREN